MFIKVDDIYKLKEIISDMTNRYKNYISYIQA